MPDLGVNIDHVATVRQARKTYEPDPVWGGHGGRVYATAMAALTLEVYYRYVPLSGESPQVAKNR